MLSAKMKPREVEAPTIDPSLIPVAPDWLGAYAKEEWERVVGELYFSGTLAPADVSAFAAYCEAWDYYRRCVEASQLVIKSERFDERKPLNKALAGILKKNEKTQDHTNPHSICGVTNVARREYLRMAQEFGVTPAARTSINANKTADDDPVGRRYF